MILYQNNGGSILVFSNIFSFSQKKTGHCRGSFLPLLLLSHAQEVLTSNADLTSVHHPSPSKAKMVKHTQGRSFVDSPQSRYQSVY